MPPPKITITLSDGTTGVIDADPELIRNALAEDKGATFGNVPIRRGEEVGTVSGDLLENAVSDGWKVDAGLTEGLPDIPLAGDQGPVTLERVDRGEYERSAAARSEQRFRDELAAQRAREQRERQYGVGYDAWKADPAQALENLGMLPGEAAARGVFLGVDAPLAAVQATVDQAGAYTADSPGVELTPHRGVTPGGEQPAVTWADRFDAAMGQARARTETNPVASSAFEVAGAVAPALAAGPAAGSSALARLTALAPTGRIASYAARLGVRTAAPLAAKAAAPGLAGSLARIGAPALALGVEGGVQGAAQGAGAAVNQLWQDGDDNTVWQYLSAGGEGLLSGGLLGAAVGAGVGTYKGVRGAKRGPVALREAGLAAEPPPEVAPPSMTAEELAAPYPKPEGPGTTTAAARKAVDLTPEVATKLRDELYPQIQRNADEFTRVLTHLEEDLDLAAKRVFVEKHATNPLGDQKAWRKPEYVRDTLGQITGLPSYEALEELGQQPLIVHDQKGSSLVLKRLREQLKGVQDELAKTAQERKLTEADLFMALDQQKRFAQKAVNRFSETGQDLLFEQLDPIVEQLKDVLESPDMWPKAVADMQRITNGTWRTGISSRQDSALKGMFGERGVPSKVQKYRQERYVDADWLYDHTQKVGIRPPEAQKEEAINRFLNAQAEDALTRAQIYGDDAVRAAAKRADELRKQLRMDLGQVSEWNRSIATGPALAEDLGVLKQIPGAGYVAELAADRAREAAYKANVKTVQEVESAGQLKGLILGAKPANDVALGVAAAPGAAHAGANPAEVADYIERLVAGDPRRDEAIAQLEQSVSPGLGKAALAALEQQRAFLQRKVGDPKDPQSEQRKFDYGNAMLRPVDALKRIGAGVDTPADRETVQELYPALWDRFVRGAMRRLAKSDATYDDRVRASRALGIPLDPTLAPDRYRALQEAAAESMMQPPQTQTTAPSAVPLLQQQ